MLSVFFHSGTAELGFPLLVEQTRAERIRHGGQEGHVLAPAGLAAQAYAIDLGGSVREFLGRVDHEVPCRLLGHRQPGRGKEVLAVHDHRALAIERRGVELAIDRDRGADLRQEVVLVIIGAELIEGNEPMLLGPYRNLVSADGQDVELTTLGGDIGRDALAERILLERDPFDGNVGVLGGELAGQALHTDHVAVVDGPDGQRGLRQRRSCHAQQHHRA